MSNPGPRWFEQRKEFDAKPRDGAASDGPDLFTLCPSCGETIYNETLAENASVCHVCGHHFRIGAMERIGLLCDAMPESFHDEHLRPTDPLQFVDSKPYPVRVAQSTRKAGRNDAFVACSTAIMGVDVELGCFDFRYMGGSMGSVVGEMITRQYERARERGVPAIVISASGGARMQEGVLSLMQMAKTCAALARLHDEAGMPYISVLTHPTTGGVAASFAMLGDVILAEPAALIGFAGPRVIEQTIGQSLPEGFQTAEYLLEHGMVDRIVKRSDLRITIGTLLRQMLGMDPVEQTAHARNVANSTDPAVRTGTSAKGEAPAGPPA